MGKETIGSVVFSAPKGQTTSSIWPAAFVLNCRYIETLVLPLLVALAPASHHQLFLSSAARVLRDGFQLHGVPHHPEDVQGLLLRSEMGPTPDGQTRNCHQCKSDG